MRFPAVSARVSPLAFAAVAAVAAVAAFVPFAALTAFAPPAGAQSDGPTPKVIRGGSASGTVATPPAGSEKIRWADLDDGLAEAKRTGRPLLVDVQTKWCGWCRKMDKTTYADPVVREFVSRKFIAVRIDAEDDERHVDYGGVESTHRQFADSFRITGYPTTLFLAADGALVTQVPGFVQPELFLGVLRYIGDGHYRTKSWDAFQRAGAAARP